MDFKIQRVNKRPSLSDDEYEAVVYIQGKFTGQKFLDLESDYQANKWSLVFRKCVFI